MSTAHAGSCLCGAIRYEVDAADAVQVICHCTNCQKASGSTFEANLLVKKDSFHLVKGQESLTSFDDAHTDAGNTVRRAFCKICGCNICTTNLTNPWLAEHIFVMLGCLEDWTFIPDREYYCKRKAPWIAFQAETEKFQAMS